MRSKTGFRLMLAGALCLGSFAATAVAADAQPVQVDEQAAQRGKASRLKYRSKGPVCLCGGGLSEADIQQMQRERPVNARVAPAKQAPVQEQ